MQQRIEKWQRWLDGPIKASVITMHHHRQIWRGLEGMIQARDEDLPESAFWQHYFDVYAETQAMAVRRQADRHPDVASLAKLVTEIAEDCQALTVDWWVGLWQFDDARDGAKTETLARRQFAAEFGGDIGDYLDPQIAEADLDRMDAASADVKAHVDKHIAHAEDPGRGLSDPGAAPAEAPVTLGDVHDAIDVIGDVFKRYYLLLTAASMAQLEPVIQHDWLAPFREPWIRDES